ncbi:n-alpha-acetyltransferase 38, NatC auxiliary subunit-like protein [Fimicolochytrium jonesii]|uniref:n-alpha-acetyltransferase 38, NatC auxiliary subunit-like protein n=1 Tax=Fimicolochytrium jonesii TaxID=1396493 RepID=UPI0022FDBD47|nr:n-alpha-acetyltransferase 38, NatC auxiliary subunit-like protein [Fimicolochytrium jonesii]KAI8819211.1 n-alpha-acetyltransferase 38, NatC auxiliary subunit-like protein [Fimicolochytrium jonesii]
MSEIQPFVNSLVSVLTADGRVILGTLRGFDQTTNLILSNSTERVFGGEDGVEQVPLGLYIIRGDNIAAIGSVDQERDAEIEWDSVQAQPLAPLRGMAT